MNECLDLYLYRIEFWILLLNYYFVFCFFIQNFNTAAHSLQVWKNSMASGFFFFSREMNEKNSVECLQFYILIHSNMIYIHSEIIVPESKRNHADCYFDFYYEGFIFLCCFIFFIPNTTTKKIGNSYLKYYLYLVFDISVPQSHGQMLR